MYLVAVLVLLWQAFRVMFRSLSRVDELPRKSLHDGDDRTGRLTIHPELLNKEGEITDEDLLTVRFSNDLEPPQSSE
ncbi:DUF2973 domain-containing protein [Prochlorococcus marinus]|uniref:DUF2973 domain-containing protein n=1 Tax=Prochlorococcus marinus TaxID=1219 RepID=UPI002FBED869